MKLVTVKTIVKVETSVFEKLCYAISWPVDKKVSNKVVANFQFLNPVRFEFNSIISRK